MQKLRLISALICLAVIISFSSTAMASKLGIVDLGKVIENYSEAQEVTADLKVKEKELQQFVLDAQKQIKAAKTPVEKNNLEKQLGEQFNIKKNAFAKQQAEKWQEIEDDVFEKIKKISKSKKFDMVLNKQSVIVGGNEITDQVVKELNSDAKKQK